MRSVVAAIITALCLPKRFEKWSLETRFKYSQRLWRNLDLTVKFAIWVTISFLVVIFLFSFASGCAQDANCTGSKYAYFWSARPNEIGDTLAGVSGSLAFFWLIVTVVLQGKQLSAQRRELALTRREFEKMSDAQEKQVEIMDVQKDIFLKEQKQREELEARAEFQNLLDQLDEELALGTLRSFGWKYYIIETDENTRFDDIYPFYHSNMKELKARAKLELVSGKLAEAEKKLLFEGALVEPRHRPSKSGPILELFQIVKKMVELESGLSAADQSKLRLWRIIDIYNFMQSLMDADVWEAST